MVSGSCGSKDSETSLPEERVLGFKRLPTLMPLIVSDDCQRDQSTVRVGKCFLYSSLVS